MPLLPIEQGRTKESPELPAEAALDSEHLQEAALPSGKYRQSLYFALSTVPCTPTKQHKAGDSVTHSASLQVPTVWLKLLGSFRTTDA